MATPMHTTAAQQRAPNENPRLSRRALLGSTGAVAAVATIAAVPAVAGSLPVLSAQAGPVDPHVGLARRLAAAQAEMDAALAAYDVAEASLPAWAQVRPDPDGYDSGWAEIDPETRQRLDWPRWLSTRASPDDVTRILGLAASFALGPNPDLAAKHQERERELVAAIHERSRQQKVERDRHGSTAAKKRCQAAGIELEDVCDAIIDTPARTMSALLMKLAVLAGPDFEERAPEDDDNEEAMLRTIIADVRRLAVAS